MAGNPECKKDGHKMHMCSIKSEELEKREPEKYRQLTENPKFECGNCGAKVNKCENVCDPVELQKHVNQVEHFLVFKRPRKEILPWYYYL